MTASAWLRRIAIGALLVILGVAITLALPVARWRTGRMPVPPLVLSIPRADARPVKHVWIDSDAACGYALPSTRTSVRGSARGCEN